jgi:hypothetical protein
LVIMRKIYIFFWWLWNYPGIVWMKFKSYFKR